MSVGSELANNVDYTRIIRYLEFGVLCLRVIPSQKALSLTSAAVICAEICAFVSFLANHRAAQSKEDVFFIFVCGVGQWPSTTRSRQHYAIKTANTHARRTHAHKYTI